MKYTYSDKDPLATYPVYALLIYNTLGSIVKMLASLKESENMPGLYQSTRSMTESLITAGKTSLPMFKKQVGDWKKLVLTAGQQYDIDSLQEIVEILESVYDKGIEMSKELSPALIDQLQNMADPSEIAKLLWMGEIKLPQIE